MSITTLPGSWYDFPREYDIAFRPETRLEARFVQSACERYAKVDVRRILEPACGSGRIIVELAAVGFDVTGFDLNGTALDYARARFRRRQLDGTLVEGDLTDFAIKPKAHAAFNFCNTFRHLLTEADARRHLELVAKHLVRGGLYLIGLHLYPADADYDSVERWTESYRGTKVTCTLRCLSVDEDLRREQLELLMTVRAPSRSYRVRSSFAFRTYDDRQLRALLASVPELELVAVHDFGYDIGETVELDEDGGDTVLVLRRR
ncbi:Methyltransferase domain protein [Planctomycetes bacterium Pan216]|uniref:Methyltransferase domain protein n=1 Tax=Kolteria novifilia TaxID=2527975 RepID=A0A518B5K9_9BACT|nr:Methyltransferase domain protein [Planctomycetes bacterium Pan216]